MRERFLDTDGDGIPDEVDLCPTVAEDHKGRHPDDGCPAPPDEEGDRVADADQDGIADAVDACPKEPGPANADPTKWLPAVHPSDEGDGGDPGVAADGF